MTTWRAPDGRNVHIKWMNSKTLAAGIPNDVVPVVDDRMPDGMFDEPNDETVGARIKFAEEEAARKWFRK
jgi:hypothetical protein